MKKQMPKIDKRLTKHDRIAGGLYGLLIGDALRGYRNELTPEECGVLNPDGKGNGALMRVLLLAVREYRKVCFCGCSVVKCTS